MLLLKLVVVYIWRMSFSFWNRMLLAGVDWLLVIGLLVVISCFYIQHRYNDSVASFLPPIRCYSLVE